MWWLIPLALTVAAWWQVFTVEGGCEADIKRLLLALGSALMTASIWIVYVSIAVLVSIAT